jgi:hypothetical protein
MSMTKTVRLDDEFARRHRLDLWGEIDPAEYNSRKNIGLTMRLPPFYAFALFPAHVDKPDIQQWYLFRMLRAAAKENSPGHFSLLLQLWLRRLGIEPPDGVFVPHRGSPGRPRKSSTESAYEKFQTLVTKSWHMLAIALDKNEEYKQASPKKRKQIRDKHMKSVKREEQRRATK